MLNTRISNFSNDLIVVNVLYNFEFLLMRLKLLKQLRSSPQPKMFPISRGCHPWEVVKTINMLINPYQARLEPRRPRKKMIRFRSLVTLVTYIAFQLGG